MDISKEQIQLINSIFYRLKENHYKVKKNQEKPNKIKIDDGVTIYTTKNLKIKLVEKNLTFEGSFIYSIYENDYFSRLKSIIDSHLIKKELYNCTNDLRKMIQKYIESKNYYVKSTTYDRLYINTKPKSKFNMILNIRYNNSIIHADVFGSECKTLYSQDFHLCDPNVFESIISYYHQHLSN